ncbi:MAG: UMP kinase [Candidatus Diapherotrites archaeon]|uniref:UMP kinase n=1 Tax=Candidatus Iainarchaeum sp. TaxID=3101447 RepID=A0A8T3YMW1_9ARCH|nr:UMP kinase [Candidatus Diapherotrites archaeon]
MFDIFETVHEEMQAQEHMDRRAQPYRPDSSSGLFVVSIGGSLIADDAGPNAEKIRAIADMISSLHSSGKRFVLVVGGGRAARNYVEAMRSFSQNNFGLDLLGIHITRANAMLVANAVPSAHREVLTDITRASAVLDSGKIPVFGGIMPFFTTDSVGALLAEHLGAVFVNLTNVDGIYDSNPADNAGAKRFEEIGYGQLVSLIVAAGSVPGQNVVLDLACCLILQRSRIPAVVLNGNDMQNFSNYINGSAFTGTVIRDIGAVSAPETSEPGDDAASAQPRAVKKRKKRKGQRGHDDYERPNPYHIDF